MQSCKLFGTSRLAGGFLFIQKNADFPFGKPTLEAYPAPIRLREKFYYIFTIS